MKHDRISHRYCKYVMLIFMAMNISTLDIEDRCSFRTALQLRVSLSSVRTHFHASNSPYSSFLCAVPSSLLSLNSGVFLSFIFLSLKNYLFIPSSWQLLYYVFVYTGARAWTSNTSSPCVLPCCVFSLFCLRMHPYGIQCNFKC